MQIHQGSGIMNLDDDDIPSTDDKNEIIGAEVEAAIPLSVDSMYWLSTDEREYRMAKHSILFHRLCDASCEFPKGLTNYEFQRACREWLKLNK